MAKMALVLSVLALLATFYQAYLQRVHNEKSVKPLIQINVKDQDRLIYVHIQNNGLGPFIIEKLIFTKNKKDHCSIEDCLNLDPNSYQQNTISNTVNKVILPGNYHDVFSIRFKEGDTPEEINDVRLQLSVLRVKAEGRDIYDNRITVERELDWFVK
jgi:hypothetical protein